MTEPNEPDKAATDTPSTWPNIKVARAAQHLLDLQSRIGLWQAGRPFGAIAEVSDDRLKWRLLLRVTSPPPIEEWGTIMGDCVHNLRSAMDAAVWDLATADGRSPARRNLIGFPIVAKSGEWRDATSRQLEGVSTDVVERIRLLQPFHRPAAERPRDPLALLQRLDNDDKHRSRIIALIEWQEMNHDFSVEFESDEAASRNVPPNTTLNVPDFSDGALLAEHRTVDPIAHAKGGFQFAARLCIETQLGPRPLLETLGGLINYVHTVLAVVYGRTAPTSPVPSDDAGSGGL